MSAINSPYPDYLANKYGTAIEQLGEGDYGEIAKTSKGYAVKVIISDLNYGADLPDSSAIVDYSVGNNINSQYVVKYIETYIDGKYTYLIMALGQSLPKIITKEMFTQICLAVADVHRANIAHHDLKPENFVLIDGVVKLIDFGLSKIYPEIQLETNRPGNTMYFKAPEDLLMSYDPSQMTQKPNPKSYYASDVWALGIILLMMELRKSDPNVDYPFTANYSMNRELLLGQILDFTGLPQETNTQYFAGDQVFANSVKKMTGNNNGSDHKYWGVITDVNTRELLRKMLTIDPNQRSTIFDILQQPYFSGMSIAPQYLQPVSLYTTLKARTLRNLQSKLVDNRREGNAKFAQAVKFISDNCTGNLVTNYNIYSAAVTLFIYLSNYTVIPDQEINDAAYTCFMVNQFFYSSWPKKAENNTAINPTVVSKYLYILNTKLNYDLIIGHPYAYLVIFTNNNVTDDMIEEMKVLYGQGRFLDRDAERFAQDIIKAFE